MDWFKKHFDRAILAALGLLLLATAGLIISQALSFNDIFASRNSAKKPNNSVPPPAIELIKERIALIANPDEWGAHKGSLFVSDPYLIKNGGEPVNPLEDKIPLHPPIPNEWLVKYNLDYADPGLLNADPDGDKFSNLEEFLGHTDPTDPKSRPAYITKLRLEQFIQVPFRLKFSGTPDEGQTFSINTLDLKQPTQFLKLGDMIPRTPYKIINYEKKSVDKNGMELDVSELTVENQDTGQKIALVYDKPVNDPTVYAKFKYLWDGSEPKVKKNDHFSVKPDDGVKYKLIDISDSEAVIESPQGDKIHVPKGDS
ncbi:MAG: hypothetical protein PHC88_04385 [Terrimicrobiaceae bacterium]|nr:hypothetical protein [Terrimicrobiaceae bacterium]